jgi:branched-chain amino acid transport system substrate-binding protein
MSFKSWAAVAASLSLAALGLTGCGDSSTADPSSASTLKGDPIVIGTICSCSGVQASGLAKSSDGISAWVQQVNDAGGLNGHPVKLIVKDDAGDPTKALQAAKELVEDDKVVAIVGETSVADAAFQTYVETAKVPVVGGLAVEKTFLVSPMFFASGASAVIATYGMMREAKAQGAETIGALYCAESPVCAEVDALGQAFGQLVGIGWESGKISATQPNYIAQCLAMEGAGVDALFVGHNPSVSVRLAADCTNAGYEPDEVGQLVAIGPEVIASPDFDGALLIGANALQTDESVPGVKAFRNAAEAYDPGLTNDPQFNINVLQSWAGAKLFEAAAKAVRLSPSSAPADVLKGLYSLKDETLDGIAPPLNFTEGKPALPSCYFVAAIDDMELVAKQSEPICLSADELDSVGQLLAEMAG